MTPKITPLAAFADNYIWVLEHAGETWVVDPGDAAPVKAWLAHQTKGLDGILITHHHRDHIGGVAELAQPGLRVVGPAQDRLAQTTEAVRDGQQIRLAGLDVQVLAVPGHTLNHLAFYSEPEGQAPLLFCGDTLFVAGCGRLFEGTPGQMYESLGRLAELPESTRIYCAHEYTLANLHFASRVDPDNREVRTSIETAKNLRDQRQPTVPSTLAREKLTNPFLRAHLSQVKRQVAQHFGREIHSDLDCFAGLRQWKDFF